MNDRFIVYKLWFVKALRTSDWAKLISHYGRYFEFVRGDKTDSLLFFRFILNSSFIELLGLLGSYELRFRLVERLLFKIINRRRQCGVRFENVHRVRL